YEEGLKYREIATALNLREGTVAKRIHTAKAKLEEKLRRTAAPAAIPLLDQLLRRPPEIEVPADLAVRVHSAVATAQVAATAAAATKVGSAMAARVSRYTIILATLAVVGVGGFWMQSQWSSPPQETAGATHRLSDSAPLSSQLPAATTEAPTSTEPATTQVPVDVTPATAGEAATPRSAAPGPKPALKGVVRTADERPVVGAVVDLLDGEGSQVVQSTTTDDGGKYAFLEVPTDALGDAQPKFSLGGGSGNGAPSGRRRMMGGPTRVGGDANREQRSDGDGRIGMVGGGFTGGEGGTLVMAETSYVRLRVAAPEHVVQTTPPFAVVAGKTEERDFVLVPGETLRGVVRSDAGYPIADASVEIIGFEGANGPSSEQAVATTNTRGEFAFETLAKGHYLLQGTSPDFITRSVVVEVGEGPIEIVLGSAGQIAVTVVDTETTSTPTKIELRLQFRERFLRYGNTTAPGSHTFESLPPGEYMVIAYRASLPLVQKKAVVRAGEATDIQLELAAGCTVTGRITPLDPEHAHKELRIVAAPLDASGIHKGTYQQGVMDANNDFLIEHLPPGQYLLLVYPERRGNDNALGYRSFAVQPGSDQLRVDLEIDGRRHGEVVITVSTTDDATLPFVQAALRHISARRYVASAFSMDGTELRLLAPPGQYTLAIGAPGFVSSVVDSVTIAEDSTIREAVTLVPRAPTDRTDLSDHFAPGLQVTVSGSATLRSYLALLAPQSQNGIEVAPEVESAGILDQPTKVMFPVVEHSLPYVLKQHGLAYKTGDQGTLRIVIKPKQTQR
ncbi:MAG: carboxypeptidase regulatory-like domain-containing protein, partial [Planctomycetota bacterium]